MRDERDDRDNKQEVQTSGRDGKIEWRATVGIGNKKKQAKKRTRVTAWKGRGQWLERRTEGSGTARREGSVIDGSLRPGSGVRGRDGVDVGGRREREIMYSDGKEKE